MCGAKVKKTKLNSNTLADKNNIKMYTLYISMVHLLTFCC